MLDNNLKEQVKTIFSSLENSYTLKAIVSKTNSERSNLISLITEVAQTSPKINVIIEEGDSLELEIYKNDEKANFIFRAVPTGHEFTTLLLGILNLDGKGKNFPDETVREKIKALKGDINIRSYISLSCTNCPEVVQNINMMSILNPSIKHQIIDGGLFENEVKELNIQSVPTVYVGNKVLSVGRTQLSDLINKLETIYKSEVNISAPINKHYDVIIAGGGPAGTAAAIYSARKGFKVAIIAERMGGQILETVAIENMISVKQTTGKELATNLGFHIEDYDIDILDNRKIQKVNIIDGVKHIITSYNEDISAPALIIATGASWRMLQIPGEDKYIGSGIAFCTHCDGPFYKNKNVVVIGGGNSGLEAAIDLSNIATHVTLLEYSDELKGDIVLQEKLRNRSNVEIVTSAQSLEIIGDGSKVTALDYKDLKNNKIHTINTDGIFIQIGLKANSAPFSDIVETNKIGEIKIDEKCKTNIPGIYAAGDVSTVPYKQIIIAMGEGAKSALSAFEDSLKNQLK